MKTEKESINSMSLILPPSALSVILSILSIPVKFLIT